MKTLQFHKGKKQRDIEIPILVALIITRSNWIIKEESGDSSSASAALNPIPSATISLHPRNTYLVNMSKERFESEESSFLILPARFTLILLVLSSKQAAGTALALATSHDTC
ncbi:hypothetical protein GOBAR_AA39482 [Gossypium barbadense]|uniref:Uncharacterized protein n=2 Tax=Gossypium TaxID=3633 RepID=A0A2P5VR12_GOSBA|nr:hypothetical protein GOBAR_AA39482 [Gossypium barbadense]TYG87713.1 hypothetical protein ES288_A13G238000v1 [Gossypium darwinii]